jgi:integration host factor subunit beta
MLKSELVQNLAKQNPHLYPRDLEKVVNAILGTISDALARGDRVELRGLGTFGVTKRGARTGHNPKTGDLVAVSEKAVPVFKSGKEMRRRLNPTSPSRASKKVVQVPLTLEAS